MRRITVRTSDEFGLEDLARSRAQALFLADPVGVCAELRAIAVDSIHQIITRDDLIRRLADRGFALRKLRNPAAASGLVAEATARYLRGARERLIQGTLLPQPAARRLLEELDAGRGDAVLTGRAGGGKTACVIELVQGLEARGVPVLVFRLDRIQPVSNTEQLGKELGLEESPALALAAGGRESVLIVDQLDAVGTTSGRGTSLLDLIADLLAEIRGLGGRTTIHPVIVCRKFDWDHDPRLRNLMPKDHVEAETREFGVDDVRRLLSAAGFDQAKFRPTQVELLRLPQNLSLFLDAGFDTATAPAFDTAKELFDRYWQQKRQAVSDRAGDDRWLDTIALLTREMTATQQLSVPREKLDHLPAGYLAQMASEGVLTFDGRRYGFGHESFFDYCFARTFFTDAASITTFLAGSEQHLFRRAQLRQVLAYLRDANHDRYCRELQILLHDQGVRGHLKDLALALLLGVPDPTDGEWAVLQPLLDRRLAGLMSGQPDVDPIAAHAWRYFYASSAWFRFADQKGFVEKWLASDSDALVNMIVSYVRPHERHAADRVAELLEPYVDRGGEWPAQLRFVMQWADHSRSRRFFELFLRLIDNGTLDEARGPIAQNSTFWSLMYSLGKERPEWIPEVIVHWVRRRLNLARSAEGGLRRSDAFHDDNFAGEPMQMGATRAPAAFVTHVLPIVLEISDAATYQDRDAPRHDSVWPEVYHGEHQMAAGACLEALTGALRTLAADPSTDLRSEVEELRRRDTHVANFLLLNLYEAGAERFADEAADLLSREPWRLKCGLDNCTYWTAMQLLEAIVPPCSPEHRAQLEAAVLGYTSPWERSAQGYKFAGWARYNLLAAIPAEYRSRSANDRYGELERKFRRPPEGAPREIAGGFVGSPIPEAAAERMTDDHWLGAMARYSSNSRSRSSADFLKGGAWELGHVLKTAVEKEPERFGRLALRIPEGSNPAYLSQILAGLKSAPIMGELKLAVCRKAWVENRLAFGADIVDVLGAIKNGLPVDASQMLEWLATEHPDPTEDTWPREETDKRHQYDEILTNGINTTRGRAANAIRDLVLRDAAYIGRFRPVLDRLVRDPSTAVRSCVMSTLYAVAVHDFPLAIRLFEQTDLSEDRLLATPHAYEFLRVGIHQHFEDLRSHVDRMLASPHERVAEAGAILASLAALNHESTAGLATQAAGGTARHRLGVTRVAVRNVGEPKCRTWCEAHLPALFNDGDVEVRREAATCFRHLDGKDLESYAPLIAAFCESEAFGEDLHSLLRTLENSARRLPGITIAVCEQFLARFGDEAADIRTARAGDVGTIAKLIFRTYQQHPNDEWTARALDLIDRLCMSGVTDATHELEKFER